MIVRHNNAEHDHIHVVYNTMDNNLNLISVNNENFMLMVGNSRCIYFLLKRETWKVKIY